MEHDAPALFVALERSGFAAAIRQSVWIYPAANIGHVAFLTLFAGAIAVMDLRLVGGFASTIPANVIGPARTAAGLAFLGMIATGFLLFSAEASHVIVNPVFLFKLALIAAGLANIALFEAMAKREVMTLPPGSPMPSRARVAGYTSLAIWFGVAVCGRGIAYY
jgi:hypothetical protein